jgi:uracil-DNA glycosylase family 4
VTLARLSTDVIACRRCDRLVACREADRGPAHWARPVPGFGDPRARLLILGLAPGAYGANRTGRVFTGDASGDMLFAALHRAGFANQPTSTARDDGLVLRDAFVTNIVKCVPPGNQPDPDEIARCVPFLHDELSALSRIRVVLAVGKVAWDGYLRHVDPVRPRPSFEHGATVLVGGRHVIATVHVSRLNQNTRRITDAMLDAILGRARRLIGRGTSRRAAP